MPGLCGTAPGTGQQDMVLALLVRKTDKTICPSSDQGNECYSRSFPGARRAERRALKCDCVAGH